MSMKLPNWVPQVPRPTAYGPTWDAMSPNERRWSFLIDMAIVLVACGLLFCCGSAHAGTLHRHAATVQRVVDGDTVRVIVRGVSYPVRVAHIDTPESHAPPGKCSYEVGLGKQATVAAKALLRPGDSVTVITDSSRHDKYGRILGKVRLRDGRDYGTLMVAAGLARPYEGGRKWDWCSGASPSRLLVVGVR